MVRKLAAVLLAVLCVSLMIGAMGCDKSKPDPTQTVTDFWNAVKSGDFQKALSYFAASVNTGELKKNLEGDDPQTKEMANALLAKMNMVPKSSKVEGDNATVPTEITMPDLEKLMEKIFEIVGEMMGSGMDITEMSEEQITEMMMKKMKSLIDELPTVTKTVDIKLVWENEAWKMKSNPFEDIEKAFEGLR